MRKIVKVMTLAIMVTTLTGCKDKTQMILYDYSHKGITDKPTDTGDTEIKRILESIRNGLSDGGAFTPPTIDSEIPDEPVTEPELPPEKPKEPPNLEIDKPVVGPVLPPGWGTDKPPAPILPYPPGWEGYKPIDGLPLPPGWGEFNPINTPKKP